MNKALLMLVLGPACAFASAQSLSTATPRADVATFVCGGVGDADQQAIRAEAPRHNLMLTFAVSTGAYLADVDVEIKNSQGTVVLAARCGGPIMLVDLPSGGTWRVTAHSNGQSREKVLSAGAGRSAQATFIWPAGSS
jgi:hypothetical protein